MADLFLAIFWLIILCLFIAAIGFLTGGFIRSGTEGVGSRFLKDHLIGLLLLVCGFAIVKTHGLTVLLGIFLPGLAGFRYLNRKPAFPSSEALKKYFSILLTMMVLCILCAIPEFLWMLDRQHGMLLNVPHFDYLYYAKVSGFMSDIGTENRLMSLNKLYPEFAAVKTPYHYPEIWLNSFIYSITGIATLKTEMLISFPYLKGLMLTIVYVSAKESLPKYRNWQILGITIILTGITGVFFNFYMQSSWLRFHDGITQSGALMSFGRKYLFMYVFMAYAVLILWRSGKYFPFLIVMAAIPIFSVGTIPGIISAISGLVLYLGYRKIIQIRTALIGWITAISCTVFILGFYFLLGDQQSNDNIQQSILIQKLIKNQGISELKQLFFAAFYPALRIVLMYLPWIVITWLFIRKRADPGLIIFAAFALVGGNFAAAMTTGILDNGQFLYNILPLFNVVIAGIILSPVARSQSTGLARNSFLFIAICLVLYTIFTDFSYYKSSIHPYNQLSTHQRIKNLELIKKLPAQPGITGLYKIDSEEIEGLSFLDTYYRNRHFYLQFLDNYQDALNINAQPYIAKGDSLWSVDKYLLGQNELALFLRNENLAYSHQALEKFFRKTGSVFWAIGDSLYVGSYPALFDAEAP